MKKLKTKLSYIIELPKIIDECLLIFGETDNHIPFPMKRFYFISDVFDSAVRGKHAHRKTLQMLFCIKGSVKIVLTNGQDKEEIILSQPNTGIFLNKMLWHEMVEFSKDALLLIVASEKYDENDYIRDYDIYLKESSQ